MMTSAFLSTLSFSAEKNCAQNSGAKRRDDIKSLIMTSPVLETLSEVVSLSDGRRDRRRCDGHLRVDDDRPRPALRLCLPILLVSAWRHLVRKWLVAALSRSGKEACAPQVRWARRRKGERRPSRLKRRPS